MTEHPSPPAGRRLGPLLIVLLAGLLGYALFADPTSPVSLAGGEHKAQARVMGTYAHIILVPSATMRATPDDAVEQAFDAMREVERLMSPYSPDSDISRLNSAPPGEWVEVNPLTWFVVMEALRFHRLSGGAFDITIGPLLKLYNYETGTMDALPEPARIDQTRARVGSDKLLFRREGMSLSFTTDGMRVDLGAIAKGFAVDRAMDALLALGVQNAMVEAGGEIRVTGELPVVEESPNAAQSIGTKAEPETPDDNARTATPATRPWRIGLRHPRSPLDLLKELNITDCAVATSGDYEKFFNIGERHYSHIIDPRTGLPVSGGVVSATVIHPASCAQADALATTLSVLGENGSRDFFSAPEHRAMLAGVKAILYVLQDDGSLKEVDLPASPGETEP